MSLDLIKLYQNKTPIPVDNMPGLADLIVKLELNDLVEGYQRLQQLAPRRHQVTKEYFVPEHRGVSSKKSSSNRVEEHLAGALWAESRSGNSFKLPDGTDLNFLDYQVPLKARAADVAVRAVDLIGLVENANLCIIELKVLSSNKTSNSPLQAFLEALAYSAIIDANSADIASEVEEKFGYQIIGDKPMIIIMAPRNYWDWCLGIKQAGNWCGALIELTTSLESALGLRSQFLSLSNVDLEMGYAGQKARLNSPCSLLAVPELLT
jgi:hypothetical protein